MLATWPKVFVEDVLSGVVVDDDDAAVDDGAFEHLRQPVEVKIFVADVVDLSVMVTIFFFEGNEFIELITVLHRTI